MKIPANKSSYDKLYLVQPEVYNNIKPQLNEVQKQELIDLNEKNQPFEEGHETFEEEKNEEQENEEIIDNVVMEPPTKNEDPAIPVEERKILKPIKMVKNPDGKWLIKKTSEKKVKNFSCKICANKKFTTKRSLERHNITFHVKKQPIKGAELIPEVVYPKTTSPETVKAEERKNLKRKHQYNPGEFHLERDNKQFSRYEPVVKRSKGVISEIPKRSKVKRKFDEFDDKVHQPYSSGKLDDNLPPDDFEIEMENEPVEHSRAPKRLKAKRKLTDDSNNIKGKDWHWESYSQ